MKRQLKALPLMLLSALLAACMAPVSTVAVSPDADTPPVEIGGRLETDTVLSGRLLLVSDLLVPAGRILTIEAGSTVLVRASESTKIDPEYLSPATELLVRGRLELLGTAEAPVRFIPERPPIAGEVAWAGILLDGAGPSRILHTQIEDADTGVYCITSSLAIENSRLLRCRYGLIAQAGSIAQLVSSTVEEGEGGIFCWQGSDARLQGNSVRGNQEEGIYVDAGSRAILEGNLVTGNGIGVVTAASRETLAVDNRVQGNGRDWLQLPGKTP